MGFGGAVSAMLSSLKNNRRDRPSALKKLKGLNSEGKTELYFDKKATPDELKKIREKIQEDNRRRLTKNLIIIGVSIFIIIYVIGFVKF